jgi:hypothetical protein
MKMRGLQMVDFLSLWLQKHSSINHLAGNRNPHGPPAEECFAESCLHQGLFWNENERFTNGGFPLFVVAKTPVNESVL